MPKYKDETVKIPPQALFLKASADPVFKDEAPGAEPGTEVPAALDMICYSGGIISDHWWWGNLIIDLEGMEFPKEKYPILEEHDTDRKIGFSGRPVIVDGALRLDPASVKLLDTPFALDFIKQSKAGFPFEASIYVTPTKIQEIETGQSAVVNGVTVPGPGTIFAGSIYNESSVCAFGYDRETATVALSKGTNERTIKLKVKKEAKMPGRKNTKFAYSDYTTEADCTANGGKWTEGVCKDPEESTLGTVVPQTQTLGYADYTTEEDCLANGGHWYEGACNENPKEELGMPAAPQNQLVDYAQYTTETTCNLNGGVWAENVCTAPAADEAATAGLDRKISALVTLVAGLADDGGDAGDTSTIETATTEADCTAAGGHWYDVGCHAEPKPSADTSGLIKEIKSLRKLVGEQNTAIQTFTKKLAIDEERSIRLTASGIVDTYTNSSKLSDKFKTRFKKNHGVEYTAFMNQGSFNKVGFTNAVDAELKAWEADVAGDEVSGFGSPAPSSFSSGGSVEDEEARAAAKELVALASRGLTKK